MTQMEAVPVPEAPVKEGGEVVRRFTLADYELEDTATLVVQNAKKTGDLIGMDGRSPVTIDLYGSGSRQAVKALHRAGLVAQRRLHDVVRGKLDPKAAEKADEEMVEKLAACTAAIHNFPVTDAIELYRNPKLGYITKQVTAFLDEDANFAKASHDNSASMSGTARG